MSNPTCKSSYLHEVLDLSVRPVVIAEMVNQLKRFGLTKFDTIVFRGMSGSLIVPSVADILGKHMLMICKSDGNHSDYKVEGNTNLTSFVIIDDLIASGATINCMLEAVQSVTEHPTECKAIFLYRDSRDYNFVPKSGQPENLKVYGFRYDRSEKKFDYGTRPLEK